MGQGGSTSAPAEKVVVSVTAFPPEPTMADSDNFKSSMTTPSPTNNTTNASTKVSQSDPQLHFTQDPAPDEKSVEYVIMLNTLCIFKCLSFRKVDVYYYYGDDETNPLEDNPVESPYTQATAVF
jgi:hypothetical protein